MTEENLTSEKVRQIVREEMDEALTRALAPIIEDIQTMRGEIDAMDTRHREGVTAGLARHDTMQAELSAVGRKADVNEAGIAEIKAGIQQLTDMQAESLKQIRAGIQSNHQVIGELKAMQDIDRKRVEAVDKRVDDVDRDAGAARRIAEGALTEVRTLHTDLVDSHRRFTDLANQHKDVADDVREIKPSVKAVTSYVTILKEREEERAKLRADIASVFKSQPGKAALIIAGGASLGVGVTEIIEFLTIFLGG